MSLTADHIVDRRRLRRALTRWRVLAVLAIVAAVAAVAWVSGGSRVFGAAPSHIARVSINGFISGDRATLRLLDRVGRASTVRAVIVSISSPGGTVAGSEALHDALRKLAARKPTVATVGTMAASGGYIAAMGTDRIFAQKTSLVGSIGVIFQYPEVSKLLETVGVKVEQVKSSPLKAEPSGVHPTSPEARRAMEQLVAETYDWFKGMVRERRGLDDAALAEVADGRVFNGMTAVRLKLVDAIGDEDAAIAWLVAEKGVTKGLAVRDWRPGGSGSGLLPWNSAEGFARFLGLTDVAEGIEQAMQARDVLTRQGLLTVWPGRPTN